MARVQAAVKEKKVPPVHKPPVSVRRERDAFAEQIGQNRSAHIALEGPAQIDGDDIEVVPGPRFADKAATEAFMAEKVTIVIQPSTEKNPENPVMLSVNGRQCFIWRNQPTVVKRCYVERLARAKQEGISQDPGNPDPKIANRLDIVAALRYPFSIVHDPNSLGFAWLQKVLAEV